MRYYIYDEDMETWREIDQEEYTKALMIAMCFKLDAKLARVEDSELSPAEEWLL